MKLYTFLTTCLMVISVQAQSRVEASQMLHDDGYVIVKQL